MKKAILLSMTVLCLVAWLATPSFACGDKFLVNSVSPKPDDVYRASSPGIILIYRNPNSDIAKSFLSSDLENDLERIGHVVKVVTDMEGLIKELSNSMTNLVIADEADAKELATQVEASSSRALVMPVVEKSQKDVYKAAKKSYGFALKSSSRRTATVLQVDAAVRKAQKMNPGT